MKISVIVPTICRPEHLERALRSLAAQTRAADEVVVVLPSAPSPCDVIAAGASAVQVRGSEAGIVAAVNLGLATASGDVVALLDDDAEAPPHWLDRIERWFGDLWPAESALVRFDFARPAERARRRLHGVGDFRAVRRQLRLVWSR